MEEKENNVNMRGEKGNDMGSSGTIIGVIVILLIIILGGFYFWSKRVGNDAQLDEINMQSKTDDLSAIESDLNATEIENLDAELNAS